MKNPQFVPKIVPESPKSMKRRLEDRISTLESSKKRLKLENRILKEEIKKSKQREKRTKSKLITLEKALGTLQDIGLITESCGDELTICLEGVPQELLTRILSNKGGQPSLDKYPEQLRAFAMTLHFYSPKAYTYVRETLNLSLPHPRTLRNIYSRIQGEPGKHIKII